MARTARQDKVRELERALYRAGSADPGRRSTRSMTRFTASDISRLDSPARTTPINASPPPREQPMHDPRPP